MYYTTYRAPEWEITLASNGERLAGLWNGSHKYKFANMQLNNELPIFTDAKRWLDRYFRGEKPCYKELPLAITGSEFRKSVWQILCTIPYGEVVTYGDIAKQMAKKLNKAKMSAQAVGGAVGHNPFSIIVPCHRVIGSSGCLTGFGGGIPIKVKLLTHEGIDITRYKIPTKGTAL